MFGPELLQFVGHIRLQFREPGGLGLVRQFAMRLQFLGISSRLEDHARLLEHDVDEKQSADQPRNDQHDQAQWRLYLGETERERGRSRKRTPVQAVSYTHL